MTRAHPHPPAALAPNTPPRRSPDLLSGAIYAGQRHRRHGLTLALRIRRLGVRIPSGARINAGQGYFPSVTTFACGNRMFSHLKRSDGPLLGVFVPVTCGDARGRVAGWWHCVTGGETWCPVTVVRPKYAPKFSALAGSWPATMASGGNPTALLVSAVPRRRWQALAGRPERRSRYGGALHRERALTHRALAK